MAYNTTSNTYQFYDGATWTDIGAGAVPADSLDWDDFTDTMTLDATTTIDMDTNTADLNFDANTFVIDSDVNRVGIGTTTPATDLHINDGASHSVVTVEADESFDSALSLLTSGDSASTIGDATTTGWHIHAKGDTTGNALRQNDFLVSYWDGSSFSNKMFIEHDTDHIGLGTSTPNRNLHIAGDDADMKLDINSASGSTFAEILFAEDDTSYSGIGFNKSTKDTYSCHRFR